MFIMDEQNEAGTDGCTLWLAGKVDVFLNHKYERGLFQRASNLFVSVISRWNFHGA